MMASFPLYEAFSEWKCVSAVLYRFYKFNGSKTVDVTRRRAAVDHNVNALLYTLFLHIVCQLVRATAVHELSKSALLYTNNIHK